MLGVYRTGSSIRYAGALRRHTTTGPTTTSWHTRLILWRQKPLPQRFGFFLRIIRIPTVAAGIYSLGYRQGLIDSQQNPTMFQELLLELVLSSEGIDSTDCEILSESDVVGRSKQRLVATSRNHQVANVALQLVEQSRLHIAHELEQAKESLDEKRIEFWEGAVLRINGDRGGLNAPDPLHPWQIVFVNANFSNAWVTELLPRRIFVTTSLLEEVETVDELAFVMAHELSHLILGHASRKYDLSSALAQMEIVLLALDPTEGLLAVAVVGLLHLIRRGVEQSYSREHETEADDLGLRLVAACGKFDLEAGSRFMYRLHTMEEQSSSWLDSHPPSLDRARRIHQQSKEFDS